MTSSQLEVNVVSGSTVLGRVRNRSFSLGDRFCLAVAERLGRPAYTADRAWPRATTRAKVVVIR
jgi:PIN domain nuclease of toxin-antitoxin system